MKKFLLLVLSLSVLAVLSACSDSSNGGSVTPVTQPDFANADSLVGTYEVVSFKTVATNVSTISTNPADCPNDDILCSIAKMYGNKFTIKKEGDNLVAESQMQMYAKAMSISSNDVYQYILFSNMPVADFAQPVTTTKTYTGVTGRNLTALTDNPEAKFSFTKNADGTITNNITLTKQLGKEGIIDANTTVILRKTSDIAETINKNTLPVPADQITDGNKSHFTGFVEDPQAN